MSGHAPASGRVRAWEDDNFRMLIEVATGQPVSLCEFKPCFGYTVEWCDGGYYRMRCFAAPVGRDWAVFERIVEWMTGKPLAPDWHGGDDWLIAVAAMKL